MRSFIAAAVLVIMGLTSAQATSSLSFEVGGYLIDIVVGDASGPVISGVSIAEPGGQHPTSIPIQLVRVEVFDVERKVLLLRFDKPAADSTLSASFLLSVKGDVGILKVGEKSLSGSASWGM
jgi:hypothetical protein